MSDSGAMGEFAAGAPVPPVDAEDIRRVRQVAREVTRDLPERGPGEGAIGIDIRIYAERCSPGANVEAVCFRSMLIELLLHLKLLNPWLRGGDLDDAVFRVAADFPIAGIERFNPEEFLARLRLEGASDRDEERRPPPNAG
jgi:hypothetical protein